MFLRTVFGCLLAATAVMASGCVMMHPTACGVGAMGGGCEIDGCGSCIGSPHLGHRPRPLLGAVNAALTCGSGCGEVYWGEWINHPPKYCDPCDHHGNWVGAGPCGAQCWHPFQGLRNLWGYRYASVGYELGYGELGYDTGCSSCVSSELDYGPIEYLPGAMDGGGELEAPPTPQPTPDRSNGNANGRQASRRPLPAGQVTPATYRHRR
jgi:hypothetical protein